MKRSQVSEFAALASKACGISPYMAKLALYHTLDDGYGRYFHSIFDGADRELPYLVRDIGAPISEFPDECVAMAKEFIATNGLAVGEWHKTWTDVTFCDNVLLKLKQFAPGQLGEMFTQYAGIGSSFVDSLIAKRVLLDFISCAGAEEKVFTKSDRSSFLYSALFAASERCPKDICSLQFYANIEKKAREFAASKLSMFNEGAPFIGVTFGWAAGAQLREWHVYGDLVTTNVFRCGVKDLPFLSGIACFEVPKSLLETVYSDTYVCVVAADMAKRCLPVKVGNASMYTFPTADIISCKWVGTLPAVAGSFAKNKKNITNGVQYMKEEGTNNA